MAATRRTRSPAAAAAGDHLRFLRPGALARLRDARLRRRSRRAPSRPAPAPASPQPSPSPPPAPAPAATGDGESGPNFAAYFAPGSRLLAPRCPQRKKLTAGKAVRLFSPMPSPELPFEAVMEFFNAPDMVVAAH